MKRVQARRFLLVELLRDFSRRTAHERGVTTPEAREQLTVINGAARQLLTSRRALRLRRGERTQVIENIRDRRIKNGFLLKAKRGSE